MACPNEFDSSMRMNDIDECDMMKDLVEIEEVHVIRDPKVGMEFDSVDEYMEYYTNYANQKGFPMKIRSTEKGENGETKFVVLACARSGCSISKSKNTFNLRPVSKTGCNAKIRGALVKDEKVRVQTLTLDHNHVMSPKKSRFYKKNRNMSKYVKRRLELNDRAGIRPNKNFSSFLVEAGGHENVSFSQKDCYNYLDKVRQLRLGDGDAMALQNYFKKMQANNTNFYYLMDLDDDGRLQNVFWADARSRATYEEFGDAITFDTTYLTNKYDMPFAPFVGVNHHGQSILLGCGLISHEDIESFSWLFKTWLVCMNGRAPTAIITNQDKAMKKAIEIVFPNARHRWCLWHIMKKLPEKLSSCNQYESIKYSMQKAVYDLLTCKEFEERWHTFIEKYNLKENDWLSGLYDERSRWVPTFLKSIFWAGMSSTQRSESMNAFFDGCVNSRTTLKQFVEQYENALRSKVQKENEADFNSFDHWIPCLTDYPFEKQFQDVYTTTKFQEFQEEVKGKLYCAIDSVKVECGFEVYDVTQDMFGGTREATFRVYFKEDECTIKCNCQLFESRGILCRHALTVLLKKRVRTVPDKFILRRWRKDVKRCHKKVKIIYCDWTLNPENERFDRMCNSFYEAADLATNNEDKTKIVMHWIKRLVNVLKTDDGTCGSNQLTSSREGTQVGSGCKESNNIRSPLSVHRKGRPRFKRLESKIEKVVRSIRVRKGKKKEKEKGKGKEKEKGKEKAIEHNMDFTNLSSQGDYFASVLNNNSQVEHGIEDYMRHGAIDLNLQVEDISTNANLQSSHVDNFPFVTNHDVYYGGGFPFHFQEYYNPYRRSGE